MYTRINLYKPSLRKQPTLRDAKCQHWFLVTSRKTAVLYGNMQLIPATQRFQPLQPFLESEGKKLTNHKCFSLFQRPKFFKRRVDNAR